MKDYLEMQARAKEAEEEYPGSESESSEASPHSSPKGTPKADHTKDQPPLPSDQPPHQPSRPKDTVYPKVKEPTPLEYALFYLINFLFLYFELFWAFCECGARGFVTLTLHCLCILQITLASFTCVLTYST